MHFSVWHTDAAFCQKLRNILLEIIYRLPQTEALKEYVPELCKALMKILRVENEDNAVVCVKIIIDLHRSFRQVLEDQVQPFLEIVQEIFQNMEQTVKDAFDNPDITTVSCVHKSSSRAGVLIRCRSHCQQHRLDPCPPQPTHPRYQPKCWPRACLASRS